SWSAIVQSGGQATPGTDAFAYALCAQQPAPPAGGGGGGGAGGGGSGGGGGSPEPAEASSPPAQPSSTASAPATPAPTATTPVTPTTTPTGTKAGSLSVGKGSSKVVVAWPAGAFGTIKVKVRLALAPKAVAGKGTIAVLLTVRKVGGGAITRFRRALDLR